jgi:hypothetical protein
MHIKEPKEKTLQFHILVGWVGDTPAVSRVYSAVGTQDCLRAATVSSKRSVVQAISNQNMDKMEMRRLLFYNELKFWKVPIKDLRPTAPTVQF